MNASHWPTWLEDVWAKSPAKGADGKPESLAQHTWAVLQRLTELIELRPDLPQRLKMPRLWHILFWAAFLHDFGKAAQGFQSRLRGGKPWVHRHEVLSLAFVDWIADAMAPDETLWLVAAIASHHKDASDIKHLYPPPDEFDDQVVDLVSELEDGIVRGMWRWLAECGEAWIHDLGLERVDVEMVDLPEVNAAVELVRSKSPARIHHWLRVYRRFAQQMKGHANVEQIVGGITLRGSLTNADHSASAHAGRRPSVAFNAADVLAAEDLQWSALYEHQRDASEVDGPVLLTAPTGSGKTEAALLWAARQSTAAEGMPRLFYTLPYQASMNAMKERLDRTFGNSHVGLQHGRSLLALYRLLRDKDYSPEKAAGQARWERDLVRLNYPPVRVLSPYQMLKGMYRLRGYEALLTDYHDSGFVFDEIHAYEVKRLALILKTIEFLGEHFNARFLVMSATFPTLIKQWLRATLGTPVEISATADLYEQFTRHRIVCVEGELLSDSGLEGIVRDARAGKSVLVTCNLVRNAQQVFAELTRRLGEDVPVELLHGRFTGRDRLAKEKVIQVTAGAKSKQRQPIVLVATQVVEVSLDIDLDTIYTEPAPLEALVQRFGRVNRRRLQADLAPVHVFHQPDDGQYIYDDLLVQRTLAILDREDGRLVDESRVGDWLDEIYAGQVAEQWAEVFQHAASEFEAACVKTLQPFEADYNLERLFYRAFDGIEVLPQSLYDEFEQLKEAEPIRAYELLVPISWGRYCALADAGKVLPREDNSVPIVDAYYDSRIGLLFD